MTRRRKHANGETETGMAAVGNAPLGRDLIAAAQEKNRDGFQQQVVGRVQEILTQLEKQRRYRASCLENIALLERKLAAINAGAFTVSTYGNVLTFTDPQLQAAAVTMAECVNCGAPARRG